VKIKISSISMITLIGIFIALGCSSGSSSTGPGGGGGGAGENTYTATTNYGDIVRLIISSAKDGTYSWTNETLNQSGNGSYTTSTDPNLSGIYITDNNHYIIESTNLSFVTDLDFGRTQNYISIGISSEQNLNTASLTGDYIFMCFSDNGIEEGGGYRLNSDSTFTWGIAPEPSQITSNFNYFQGSGSGTWHVSSQDSSRIEFTEGGQTSTGTIYPGKMMIVSDQYTQGLIVGIKYPSSPLTFNDIAGTYKVIDYTEEGDVGIGRYTIPSSPGPLSYYIKYGSDIVQGTSSGNISRHPYINNVFQFDDYSAGQYNYTAYCIYAGNEIMIHMTVPNDTTSSSSCGYGLRIN